MIYNAWYEPRVTLVERIAHASAAYTERFGVAPSAFLLPLDTPDPLPPGCARSALVRPDTVYAGQNTDV